MAKDMRLDKFLTRVGAATRSEAKKLAKEGRILVNGRPVRDTAMKIEPGRDEVAVDGVVLEYREHVYLMMNKPAGVITATVDARQTTVLDLLDDRMRAWRPFPVGRLDKDTEGLLLLTTDGALAHGLLSPRRHVPKTYIALVEGRVSEADIRAFAAGVRLEDGYVTMPAELSILAAGETAEGAFSEVELTIMEGKFHQVKRMFLAVGKRVVRLKRIRMGPLVLDPVLAPGDWRELTPGETRALLAAGAKAAGTAPGNRTGKTAGNPARNPTDPSAEKTGRNG
jgi:16S rRNA pseudouridine516 synthase